MMGRMLYVYSSLFISIMLNVPKLFALREDSVVARFVRFDVYEILFQTGMNFLFCLCIFYVTKDRFRGPAKKWLWRREGGAVAWNVLLLFLFTGICIMLQRRLFAEGLLPGKGIGLKFILALLLIGLELKILDILRASKRKDMENVQLRNAFLKAEMELLKGQLQPHFFFNALSSLSGVVREDPAKAQYYISQLSKVFRHSLQKEEDNLVTLREELDVVKSYAALLKMRHESGFRLEIEIADTAMGLHLPHMSLQPLVENALKHNMVMSAKPLVLRITVENRQVVVRNNLQPVSFPEAGTGIGLANLNERYKILMKEEIVISMSEHEFIVKLPLK